MQRSARTALIAWAGLSMLVAASLLLIYVRLGSTGFEVFIQQPPLIGNIVDHDQNARLAM